MNDRMPQGSSLLYYPRVCTSARSPLIPGFIPDGVYAQEESSPYVPDYQL